MSTNVYQCLPDTMMPLQVPAGQVRVSRPVPTSTMTLTLISRLRRRLHMQRVN